MDSVSGRAANYASLVFAERHLMSKRTWRWVTRDSIGTDDYNMENCVVIWPHDNEPQPARSLGGETVMWFERWPRDPEYTCFDTDEFEAVTGITVPTDHPVKVDFSGVCVLEE